MKSLYILVLVSLCQVLASEKAAQLKTPTSINVTVLDNAFKVSWSKVDSGDDNNPVIGYKVRVWEVKTTKTTKYVYIFGILHQYEEEQAQPIDPNSEPDDVPLEIITSAEETTATVDDVKQGVTYEIRVLAFTKTEEGPMSSPIRIKLG